MLNFKGDVIWYCKTWMDLQCVCNLGYNYKTLKNMHNPINSKEREAIVLSALEKQGKSDYMTDCQMTSDSVW